MSTRFPVMARTLGDQARPLIGWGVGVAALVAVEAGLWPMLDHVPGFRRLLVGLPAALRSTFHLGAMFTGRGFLNAELFSIVLPTLFIVFAVGGAARMVAGQEEEGRLEVVLAAPVSRTRFLLESAGGLIASVVSLGVVLFLAVGLASVSFGLGVGWPAALSGALAVSLLGIEFGCLALAVGAMTGRRTYAMAVAGLVAVAAYVLYIAGGLVPSLSAWRGWSPFDHALQGGPIGAGLPGAYGWLVLVAVACVAVALPVLEHRDLGLGR